MTRLLIALVLAGAALGCSKGESASCAAAGEAFVALAEKEIEAEGGDEALEEAKSGLPGVKAQLVETCREDKWDVATRKCVIAAETPEALEACRPEERRQDKKTLGPP